MRSKTWGTVAILAALGTLLSAKVQTVAHADDCTSSASACSVPDDASGHDKRSSLLSAPDRVKTFNDHRLRYGVGNYGKDHQYYWMSKDASKFSVDIKLAVRNWVNTTRDVGVTTPISYRLTSTKSRSRMDFYIPDESDDQVWAYVTWWRGDRKIDASQENWTYCRVFLSDRLSQATNAVHAIVGHEVGHCMGLGHVDMPGLLMHSDIGQRHERRASADELRGINWLYAR